ncbi:MAG: EpsG family protein [Eubacteriales bacterium]|nr:EpsG family protein [Eubacteriales bacterium]
MNYTNCKTDYTKAIVGFIVLPFASALKAIFDYKGKTSILVITLFTTLYGYSAIAQEGIDLYAYVMSLENFENTTFDESIDKYVYIVSLIISKFTSNGHILMAAFGCIYGLLMSLSLKFFNSESTIVSKQERYIKYVVVFIFVNIFSLSTLGGVRYATAFYLLFLGLSEYILTSNKLFLLFVFLTPLIHFSYYIYIICAVLFLIFRQKPKAIFFLLILSFFFGQISISSTMSSLASLMGEGFSERSNSYLNVNTIDYNNSYLNNWTGTLLDYIYYFENAFLAYLLLRKKNFSDNEGKLNFSVACVGCFFILTNVVINVPHLGLRSQIIARALTMIPLYLYFKNWQSRTSAEKAAFILIVVPSILVSLNEIIKVMGTTPISLAFYPLPFLNTFDSSVFSLFF